MSVHKSEGRGWAGEMPGVRDRVYRRRRGRCKAWALEDSMDDLGPHPKAGPLLLPGLPIYNWGL